MQTVVIRMLPDGSGRVCIHWLFQDPEGPIQVTDRSVTASGPQIVRGRRWRMACNPTQSNVSVAEGGRLTPSPHSDDPRAVTCPKCMATAKFQEAMIHLQNIEVAKGV